MAVLARAAGINLDGVRRIWNDEVSRGAADSASVSVSMLSILQGGFPLRNSRLYWHLFPRNLKAPYPLSKFLALCALAAGESGAGRSSPRPEVQSFVTEPWMRQAIKVLNPGWRVPIG